MACPQPLIWILCTTAQFSGSSEIEFRCWKCAGDLVTAELSLLLLAHQKLDHEPAPGSIFENSRTHRTLQDNHQTFKCTRFSPVPASDIRNRGVPGQSSLPYSPTSNLYDLPLSPNFTVLSGDISMPSSLLLFSFASVALLVVSTTVKARAALHNIQ